MPKALRAALKAAPHAAIFLNPFRFLAALDALTDTTLLALLRFKSDFFKPPTVLALVPRKTEDLARLPLAITDTFIAFMRRFMPLAIFFMPIFIFIAILVRVGLSK